VGLQLLECGDLRHVDEIAKRDDVSTELDARVVADAEVAERVCRPLARGGQAQHDEETERDEDPTVAHDRLLQTLRTAGGFGFTVE
jgi:hypothetical protein